MCSRLGWDLELVGRSFSILIFLNIKALWRCFLILNGWIQFRSRRLRPMWITLKLWWKRILESLLIINIKISKAADLIKSLRSSVGRIITAPFACKLLLDYRHIIRLLHIGSLNIEHKVLCCSLIMILLHHLFLYIPGRFQFIQLLFRLFLMLSYLRHFFEFPIFSHNQWNEFSL